MVCNIPLKSTVSVKISAHKSVTGIFRESKYGRGVNTAEGYSMFYSREFLWKIFWGICLVLIITLGCPANPIVTQCQNLKAINYVWRKKFFVLCLCWNFGAGRRQPGWAKFHNSHSLQRSEGRRSIPGCVRPSATLGLCHYFCLEVGCCWPPGGGRLLTAPVEQHAAGLCWEGGPVGKAPRFHVVPIQQSSTAKWLLSRCWGSSSTKNKAANTFVVDKLAHVPPPQVRRP